MNKIILLVLSAFYLLCPATFATTSQTASTSYSNYSPQVCQFSLSNYSGKVTSEGNTTLFTVGLSCPQETDAYATVVVFINNEHVASKVVKVSAKSTESQSIKIKVGSEFAGMPYKLVVQ